MNLSHKDVKLIIQALTYLWQRMYTEEEIKSACNTKAEEDELLAIREEKMDRIKKLITMFRT